MASPAPPPPPVDGLAAKRRKCCNCGEFGHNRQTCPTPPVERAVATVATAFRNRNGVGVGPPPNPFAVTPVTEATSINWEKVVYVVFDLETTGLSRRNSEIIEIAAEIFDKNGIHLEDAGFVSYVRPKNPIPSYITDIHHITTIWFATLLGVVMLDPHSSVSFDNMLTNVMVQLTTLSSSATMRACLMFHFSCTICTTTRLRTSSLMIQGLGLV